MESLLFTAQADFGANLPWLSIVAWLPFLGALALLMLPPEQKSAVKGFALVISLLTFALSCVLLYAFRPDYLAYQFVENHDWIPAFGVRYMLGLDGISLWLVLLTTFLTPLMILASFKSIAKREKEYYIALLVLETAIIGALVSLDIFLFYVFWEVMLIPMFLLIGIWGGKDRLYATIKFFLFTLVGSLLMLAGILYIYFLTPEVTLDGQHSFSLTAFLAVPLSQTEQFWLFWGFFLAFAIKVPLFPLHTWLPDAHTQAPTAGSVVLAAVLLKLGTYGMIRFAMPFFPLAVIEFAPLIGGLAVIGIIYGALVAMVQKDVKKLIAYSSVSHLGFVVLGLMAMTPQGVEGGIYQMLAHGISTGALFLCIGILYERRHTRLIKDFGGLTKQIPVFAVFFLIITLSSAGLPGMNGFIGEFLVLVGTFTSGVLRSGWAGVLAVLAATGMILSAVYLLWMFQRVMFGPLDKEENKNLKDMSPREILYLTPFVVLIFVMGVFPNLFLDQIRPSTHEFFRLFNAKIERSEGAEEKTALDLSYYPDHEEVVAVSPEHLQHLALSLAVPEGTPTVEEPKLAPELRYQVRANAIVHALAASAGAVHGVAQELPQVTAALQPTTTTMAHGGVK